MKHYNFRNGLVTAILGLLALTAGSALANAQDYNSAYRQYQQAQMRVQRECNRDGYYSSDCRRAQADAQRWQLAMQRASNYNNRYYNNGYYNNGYGNTTYGRSYRIYSNGSVYTTDSRGYELLRQAVNRGYQQGYQQGAIDRRYGRGYNYYGNNLYENGMYGYNSYVERSQYQYYYQQGFQRGYEDGYNNTFRYGYRSGSTANILGNVIGTILQLATNDR